MAETAAEIEERLRIEYADQQYDQVGLDRIPMTPERYEAWIAQQVRDEVAQQDATAEAEAQIEIRRLVRKGLPILEANYAKLTDTAQTVNQAQLRQGLADATRACIEIINAMESLGQLEAEPPPPDPEAPPIAIQLPSEPPQT